MTPREHHPYSKSIPSEWSWYALNQSYARELATNPGSGLELAVRVAFYAWGTNAPTGHVETTNKELRSALLVVDRSTGVLREPNSDSMTDAVAKASTLGLIAPASSTYCLVLPAHGIAGGRGTAKFTAECASCSRAARGRLSQRASESQSDASCDDADDIGVPLRRHRSPTPTPNALTSADTTRLSDLISAEDEVLVDEEVRGAKARERIQTEPQPTVGRDRSRIAQQQNKISHNARHAWAQAEASLLADGKAQTESSAKVGPLGFEEDHDSAKARSEVAEVEQPLTSDDLSHSTPASEAVVQDTDGAWPLANAPRLELVKDLPNEPPAETDEEISSPPEKRYRTRYGEGTPEGFVPSWRRA